MTTAVQRIEGEIIEIDFFKKKRKENFAKWKKQTFSEKRVTTKDSEFKSEHNGATLQIKAHMHLPPNSSVSKPPKYSLICVVNRKWEEEMLGKVSKMWVKKES